VEETDFRLLAELIAVFLIVSLLMNGLLTFAPLSVTGPPLKVYGYISADGKPVNGYYSGSPAIVIIPSRAPPETSLSPTPSL
jgi:hypothetical protein